MHPLGQPQVRQHDFTATNVKRYVYPIITRGRPDFVAVTEHITIAWFKKDGTIVTFEGYKPYTHPRLNNGILIRYGILTDYPPDYYLYGTCSIDQNLKMECRYVGRGCCSWEYGFNKISDTWSP